MAYSIENLFVYLDIFSNLLPFIVFVFFLKSSSALLGLRIIVLYALLSFFINGWLTINPTASVFIYESQTLVEYILFTSFVYTQLKSPKVRQLLIWVGLIYVLLFFLFVFVINGKYGFDSIPIGVEAIIVLGFAFYYLYERMNDTTTLFIYNTYQFWIVLGIVLYLAGSFFIYIFTDYLRVNKNDALVYRLWTVTNVFSIIKNILFCISILVHAKPSKETAKYHLEMSSLN